MKPDQDIFQYLTRSNQIQQENNKQTKYTQKKGTFKIAIFSFFFTAFLLLLDFFMETPNLSPTQGLLRGGVLLEIEQMQIKHLTIIGIPDLDPMHEIIIRQ